MQLPGWQRHAHPGRRANVVTVSLQTHATGKPGYLGNKPDSGLDPKSSGHMEAPAYHDVAKVTGATRPGAYWSRGGGVWRGGGF